MTDFPHWDIEDEFENPEFWQRAYNRAMQSFVKMTAERDEARRIARRLLNDHIYYKRVKHRQLYLRDELGPRVSRIESQPFVYKSGTMGESA